MKNKKFCFPQDIVEGLPGFFYCKDINLRYLNANTAYAQLLGKDNVDFQEKTDAELMCWDNAVRLQFQHDEHFVLMNRTTTTKEYEFTNSGLGIRHIRFERKPLFNADQVIGIQSYGIDITDIKSREENFLTEKQFIEDVFYNLPGLIYWKNKNFQYMGFNRNVVELSKLSRVELLGKSDHELDWAKDQADLFQKDDLEVIQRGANKITEHQLPIKRSDEKYMVVRTEKTPILNRSGDIIGILGLAFDVTDQKILTEKLIDERESAIHDLNYILSKMPGYIYWKNKNSEYMGCNESLAAFSKLRSPKDIVGKTDYDFEWGAEQADQFVKDDQEVMQTGKTLITEHELPSKKEDGKNLYVRTDKMPFYDKNGEIVGVLAIAVDITDQKELEHKLREEKDKAENANHIKTEFMRNMEHDIRTPFNGVWGMASYLMEIETDPNKKECLTDITECAKELLDYCNTILDFSKIESGAMPVIEKKFEIENVINSLVKVELPAATHKKLTLVKDFSSQIPKVVVGDSYRLHRILINLISNAIKFTPAGHVKLIVSLLKKKTDSVLIRFIVEDSGIGIPEDKQEFIFEKFSRLSQSNKGFYKGLGLGLRVVKQFMYEINGEIDIISEMHKGTQFICTVPFKLPLTDDFVDTVNLYGE